MCFFEKDSYTAEDIQGLIDNRVEESINLEFKESGSLGSTDSKKKEISKDVSSFANSSGGIIIYGLGEENHSAASLSFIDGNEYTKEWLEHVINTNIYRRIGGLQIFPVRFNRDINETVYVVKIPQSNLSPHMARDKRYYKRHNFESVPMEENEVRTLYNQTNRTELNIKDLRTIGAGHSGGTRPNTFRIANFDLQLTVINDSTSIEENFKTEILIPSTLIDIYAGYPHMECINNLGEYNLLKFANTAPIYQGEEHYFPSFRIKVTRRCFDNDNNFIVKARLYYSSGLKYRKYNLLNMLSIRDEPISEERFTE